VSFADDSSLESGIPDYLYNKLYIVYDNRIVISTRNGPAYKGLRRESLVAIASSTEESRRTDSPVFFSALPANLAENSGKTETDMLY